MKIIISAVTLSEAEKMLKTMEKFMTCHRVTSWNARANDGIRAQIIVTVNDIDWTTDNRLRMHDCIVRKLHKAIVSQPHPFGIKDIYYINTEEAEI